MILYESYKRKIFKIKVENSKIYEIDEIKNKFLKPENF